LLHCATSFPKVIERQYNKNSSAGLQEWAKAHFFVGIRTFATMKEAITSKIEEIAQRVAGSEGIEVVEVEVKGGGAPLRPHLHR